MNRYILFFLIAIITQSCYTQNLKHDIKKRGNCSFYYDKELDKEIFISYNSAPIPPNGMAEGYPRFIFENLKINSDELLESFRKDRHRYMLYVDDDGTILSCKSILTNMDIKKECEYTYLDADVMRIFNNSAKWTPAKCNGEPIAVRIIFELAIPRMRIEPQKK